MLRYRIANLGQVVLAPSVPPPTCPEIPTRADLNCQRTPDGGVLCSDGSYFRPGCPAPALTSTGAAHVDSSTGQLVPPPPFNLGQETGTEFPWLLVGIPLVGLAITLVW